MRRVAVLLPVLFAACRCAGGGSASDADGEEGCTSASCDLECRAVGRCYGSCSGGRCGCSTFCGDADAEADVSPEDGRTEDAVMDDSRDDSDGGDVAIETREGGGPGVNCRRVPKPRGRTVPPAAGYQSSVLYSGSDSEASAPPSVLAEFDWLTHEASVLDDLSEVASAGTKWARYPSADGSFVAYVRT